MPSSPKLLVLCEDSEARASLEETLASCPAERVYCPSLQALREAVAAHAGDVVIYVEDRPGGRVRDLLEWPEMRAAHVPVIAVSRFGEMRDYLAAMEAGAFDYVARPYRPEEVERILQKALTRSAAA
jgi:two-component system C4-dicarboxylate transport response regulator DctD